MIRPRPIGASFEPLLARTHTFQRPIRPSAYDCVQFVVVRDGSALVYSGFGERYANVGDILLLGANLLCGARPEGRITVTVVCLDKDYVLDHFFWQYVDLIGDRLAAQGIADAIYTEPVQLIRLGEDRASALMPLLDELVTLSVNGLYQERFHRMQALWHSVIDQVAPFIRSASVQTLVRQRARTRTQIPRGRQFAPLRPEARDAERLLRGQFAYSWSLSELADAVHLSGRQLARVFVEAYGKTPMAYLTMLRVETMARLLRETELSIAEASRRVGWASRNRATTAFREYIGVTPARYRAIHEGAFRDAPH